MRFKATINWVHTIADYAEVEIEADSLKEAKKKAKALTQDDKALQGLDWRDGEVQDGNYEVDEVVPAPEPEPKPKLRPSTYPPHRLSDYEE